MDSVHIFEFSEEDDSNSLTHVTKIEENTKKPFTKLIFVQYILAMVQDEGDSLNIMCFDLESESITTETRIEKPSMSSKILIESGDDCLYFVTGTKLGKLDISSMSQEFMIETHHSDEIIDMLVSSDNQIITT